MILSFINFTFTPIFLRIDDANFSLGLSFLSNSLSFLKIDTPEALAANKKILIKNYYKDHRIFMTSVIAAICLGGEWVIEDMESHKSSFPSFMKILRKIGYKF